MGQLLRLIVLGQQPSTFAQFMIVGLNPFVGYRTKSDAVLSRNRYGAAITALWTCKGGRHKPSAIIWCFVMGSAISDMVAANMAVAP